MTAIRRGLGLKPVDPRGFHHGRMSSSGIDSLRVLPCSRLRFRFDWPSSLGVSPSAESDDAIDHLGHRDQRLIRCQSRLDEFDDSVIRFFAQNGVDQGWNPHTVSLVALSRE